MRDAAVVDVHTEMSSSSEDLIIIIIIIYLSLVVVEWTVTVEL